MKRILAMVVCVAILATVAITGSIAYFTDSDSATNVFTVGNVVIEQHEQKRNNDKLEPFDDKTLGSLHPMVEKTGEKYVGQTFGDTNIQLRNLTHWANYVDKIVTVENKGKSEAYVRNIVAIPTGLPKDEANVDWLVVDWYNAETKTNSDWKAPSKAENTLIEDVDIDGVLYDIYVIYYGENGNGKLESGATTLPTLLGIGLSKDLDYDEDEGYYFQKGDTKTPVKFDPKEMKIYVATQAVQAAGFANAKEAFEAAGFGATIDADNLPFGGTSGSTGDESTSTVVSSGKIGDEPKTWQQLTEKDENGNSLVKVDNSKKLTYIDPSITELTISGDDVTEIALNADNYMMNSTGVQMALKTLVIGDGIKKISSPHSSGRFICFPKLTSIKLPASLEVIGDFMFYGASSLTEIDLPSGLKEIGMYAFYGCSSLKTDDLSKCANLTTIGDHAFDGCTVLGTATAGSDSNKAKTIKLPDSLTTIGQAAFMGCKTLTEITLPSNIEIIDKNIFQNCINLKKAELSKATKLPYVNNSMFMGCTVLDTVTLPDSVTWIGGYAFQGCTSLKEITLPASVTTIWGNAFTGCSNLKTIKLTEAAKENGITYGAFPTDFDGFDIIPAAS